MKTLDKKTSLQSHSEYIVSLCLARSISKYCDSDLQGVHLKKSQASEAGKAVLQAVLSDTKAKRALKALIMDEQEDDLLSTTDVAAMLGFSRPYISALVDAGEFPGTHKTIGGHRQIPRSSVEAWRVANIPGPVTREEKALNEKMIEIGVYDIPDKKILQVIKTGASS